MTPPVEIAPPDTLPRFDNEGRIVFIARIKGYVIARRPGAAPFVLTARAWGDLAVERVDV